MRKLLQTLLIFTLIFISFTPVLASTDESYFDDVEVYKIENHKAYVKWATHSEPTKGFVYYGLDPNNLENSFGYGTYSYRHESVIGGLEKDKTYYYKIISYNQSGQTYETFVLSFSTKDMKDTVAPEFISVETVQVTSDAVALRWVTDEKTKAEIYYSPNSNDLDKRKGYGNRDLIHEMFIYDLDLDQKYYLRIEAEDEDGNKSSQTITFRTRSYVIDHDSFEIYDIKPVSSDPNYIYSTKANLHWKTTFIAKSKIHYGTEPGKYEEHIDVNVDSRSKEHNVTLTGLTPNTTYYYKIETYESLYDKRDIRENLTFTTSSYSTNEPAPITVNTNTDSDLDGLSDGYEVSIGTDPLLADTDGDTYNDRIEIIYGYDPMIPGSTPETKLQASRYYMPYRGSNYELAKLKELKTLVQDQLGTVYVSDNNWNTLNNAYVYGGYPLQAIVQAIRHGGKTVHPTISWYSWRNTQTYIDYINK